MPSKQVTSKWDLLYQELLRFSETHGHCDVPPSHPSPGLHRWVEGLRNNGVLGSDDSDRGGSGAGGATGASRKEDESPFDRRRRQQRRATLSRERIDALDELGFDWKAGGKEEGDAEEEEEGAEEKEGGGGAASREATVAPRAKTVIVPDVVWSSPAAPEAGDATQLALTAIITNAMTTRSKTRRSKGRNGGRDDDKSVRTTTRTPPSSDGRGTNDKEGDTATASVPTTSEKNRRPPVTPPRTAEAAQPPNQEAKKPNEGVGPRRSPPKSKPTSPATTMKYNKRRDQAVVDAAIALAAIDGGSDVRTEDDAALASKVLRSDAFRTTSRLKTSSSPVLASAEGNEEFFRVDKSTVMTAKKKKKKKKRHDAAETPGNFSSDVAPSEKGAAKRNNSSLDTVTLGLTSSSDTIEQSEVNEKVGPKITTSSDESKPADSGGQTWEGTKTKKCDSAEVDDGEWKKAKKNNFAKKRGNKEDDHNDGALSYREHNLLRTALGCAAITVLEADLLGPGLIPPPSSGAVADEDPPSDDDGDVPPRRRRNLLRIPVVRDLLEHLVEAQHAFSRAHADAIEARAEAVKAREEAAEARKEANERLRPKSRGVTYMCGRCQVPKKGHVCPFDMNMRFGAVAIAGGSDSSSTGKNQIGDEGKASESGGGEAPKDGTGASDDSKKETEAWTTTMTTTAPWPATTKAPISIPAASAALLSVVSPETLSPPPSVPPTVPPVHQVRVQKPPSKMETPSRRSLPTRKRKRADANVRYSEGSGGGSGDVVSRNGGIETGGKSRDD